MHSFGLGCLVRLLAHLLSGNLYRHFRYRFNRFGGVQPSQNPLPHGLCWAGGTWQTRDRLVFGFNLHLMFHDRGELLKLMLTPGNVDDRKSVPQFVRTLFGKLFGDRGYLSNALRDELFRTFSGQLVTGVRSNIMSSCR